MMSTPRPACAACQAPLTLCGATLGTFVLCPECGAAHTTAARRKGECVITAVERVPARNAALAGELAARFEVVGRLGRGGEAEVLRVRPRGATRDYALKWSRSAREGENERSTREAFYATVPAHPNVLAPLSIGWAGSFEYLVFELVEGESLADLLEREGRLDPDRAADVAHQILRALAHIHDHGVIHRDVKPANLLVARDGTIRLTDFGAATAVGTEPADAVVGTPLYMAPEQVSCDVPLPASDVYALGGVLFRMLAGECPFERTPPDDMLMAHVCEPAPPVEQLATACPAELAAFLARCLAIHAAERPADGGTALSELSRIQRACGFAEYVETAPLATAPRCGPPEALRALAGASRSLVEAAGAGALFLYAVRAAAAGWTGAWLAIAGALVLLARAVRGLSAHLRGEPAWWWRSYVPWLADERPDQTTITMTLVALVTLGLLTVMGLLVAGWIVVPLTLWLGMFCAAACSLAPALLERDARLAGGAPQLRVFARESGWMYRSGTGPEKPLSARIALAEGLNRIEVWLAGGRRRRFLVWGVPGAPHRLELVDTPEGPRAYGAGSRP